MRQISFIEISTYFSFSLILRDIPNSITPQITLRLLPIPIGLLVFPCSASAGDPPLLPFPFSPVPAGTCARNRRALQQLALNVHVKHSDLTCCIGYVYCWFWMSGCNSTGVLHCLCTEQLVNRANSVCGSNPRSFSYIFSVSLYLFFSLTHINTSSLFFILSLSLSLVL